MLNGKFISWRSDHIKAIEFAIENSVDVLNYSMGMLMPEGYYDLVGQNRRVVRERNQTGAAFRRRARSLMAAISAAGREGIPFVAAAGNAASDLDTFLAIPGSMPDQPANLIVVGNVGPGARLNSSSNYSAAHVDIAAPGTHIPSTFSGTISPQDYMSGNYGRTLYKELPGTSMATPFVTGAIALYYAYQDKQGLPRGTPAEIKQRLIATSQQIPSLQGKVTEAALLDVHRFLTGNLDDCTEKWNWLLSDVLVGKSWTEKTVVESGLVGSTSFVSSSITSTEIIEKSADRYTFQQTTSEEGVPDETCDYNVTKAQWCQLSEAFLQLDFDTFKNTMNASQSNINGVATDQTFEITVPAGTFQTSLYQTENSRTEVIEDASITITTTIRTFTSIEGETRGMSVLSEIIVESDGPVNTALSTTTELQSYSLQ